jgi:hypothetical protein
LISRACQIRCTVAGLTPNLVAIVRQDQWVAPGGVVVNVAATIASTFSAGIVAFGPRPARTSPSLAKPSSVNR